MCKICVMAIFPTSPVYALDTESRVSAVVAGTYHSLFIQTDGSLWAAKWPAKIVIFALTLTSGKRPEALETNGQAVSVWQLTPLDWQDERFSFFLEALLNFGYVLKNSGVDK